MSKLFLIAGHGAGDPGAVGNGYTEAERVRALAQRIKDLGGDNVMLGDTSRNWYADNGISTLNISKEYEILEAHMDSGVESARGGHVIINSGFTADGYDSALAAMLNRILPGRANLIVGRNDLANPNRAAARGLGYRLVEFGFITNAQDVSIFNSKMDDIAKGVLSSFGIPVETTATKDSNIIGGKHMYAIIKTKGSAEHHYFDGFNMHSIGTDGELSAMNDIYKANNGKGIPTFEYDAAKVKSIKNMLKR